MDLDSTKLITVTAALGFALIAIALFVQSIQLSNKIKKITADLSEKGVEDWMKDLTTVKNQVQERISKGQENYSTLSEAYKIAEVTVNQIQAGLPPPSFKISDDEELKEAVRACRAEQYQLIADHRATTSLSEWSWFGSKSDGAKLIRTYNKLMISAFNAEFDMIRSKMRHSSGEAAARKLASSIRSLEKLAETVNVCISGEYISAKEKELNIWHSDLVRKKNEKEEAKKQRAILREQNKRLGRISDDDDEDEAEDGLDTQIAACGSELAKAKAMAAELAGDELAKLELKIAKIEEEKEELEKKFERAKSQAEITRSGYIYVISNIGSFGEGVCKIGMTRRLEPMDRVVELGDASVPYRFDVHTLAFVEDAPKLEKSLHKLFSNRRVNKENHRKEFFRVNPKEVRDIMENIGVKSSWYFDCEAKEYRESELMRQARQDAKEARRPATDALPKAI